MQSVSFPNHDNYILFVCKSVKCRDNPVINYVFNKNYCNAILCYGDHIG